MQIHTVFTHKHTKVIKKSQTLNFFQVSASCISSFSTCSVMCSDAYPYRQHSGSWGRRIRMQNPSRLCGRDLATIKWSRSEQFVCSPITRIDHSSALPLLKSHPGGESLARVFSHSADCLLTLLLFPCPCHVDPLQINSIPFSQFAIIPEACEGLFRKSLPMAIFQSVSLVCSPSSFQVSDLDPFWIDLF